MIVNNMPFSIKSAFSAWWKTNGTTCILNDKLWLRGLALFFLGSVKSEPSGCQVSVRQGRTILLLCSHLRHLQLQRLGQRAQILNWISYSVFFLISLLLLLFLLLMILLLIQYCYYYCLLAMCPLPCSESLQALPIYCGGALPSWLLA